jgi:hypothetical protein
MTKRPTSGAELAPNGPLLLTLPQVAAHLCIDRTMVYQAVAPQGYHLVRLRRFRRPHAAPGAARTRRERTMGDERRS